MLKKLKDTIKVISQKLHLYLALGMQQRFTDVPGILQYLQNGRTNVHSESEIKLITVLSSKNTAN